MDWRQEFLELYSMVAACNMPEGSQVDAALAAHQAAFNLGKKELSE